MLMIKLYLSYLVCLFLHFPFLFAHLTHLLTLRGAALSLGKLWRHSSACFAPVSGFSTKIQPIEIA